MTTCACLDPIVFGHTACGQETQGWNQPPITYNAGETFTITSGELTYTIGGTNRTIPLNGARIHWGGNLTTDETIMPASEAARRIREASEFVYNLPSPPATPWNWVEESETGHYWANPRELDEPCG